MTAMPSFPRRPEMKTFMDDNPNATFQDWQAMIDEQIAALPTPTKCTARQKKRLVELRKIRNQSLKWDVLRESQPLKTLVGAQGAFAIAQRDLTQAVVRTRHVSSVNIYGNFDSPVRTRGTAARRVCSVEDDVPVAPSGSGGFMDVQNCPGPDSSTPDSRSPSNSKRKLVEVEEDPTCDPVVELREETIVHTSDVMSWAGASVTVRSYLQSAIILTKHGDVRTQQQGRHIIRLCRTILESDYGLPPVAVKTCPPRYGYDIKFLQQALKHDHDLVESVKMMVRNRRMADFSSWLGRFWNRHYPPSTIRRSMVPYLLETVAAIKPARTDLDEQDHSFSIGDDSKLTKSDVTIYTVGTKRDVGTFIAEVQKEWIGCHEIHKDHIKAPGEAAQQFVALLSTTRVEDWSDIRFHYALVSQWNLQFFSLGLTTLDGHLWFTVQEGPNFRIGPDLHGLLGVLQYGEYLNTVIVPACRKVRQLLKQSQGLPDIEILVRLPNLRHANLLRSRTSMAPVTPMAKKTKRVPK
ncbi:hypothetical protein HDU85_007241 [Gaertneriomyces sp. JEL0708]|nr:hypothetical protein HDU85_007241 [Gaertneriomyces sp. JEL0708]